MKKIIIAETVLGSVDRNMGFFGRGGVVVHPARTSEEVLSLHRQKRADLIITDHELPSMGGARLCSAIRADAALKDVSIIVTCDPDPASLALCRDAGANAVLPKPLDPAELFARVAELIMVPQRKEMRVLLQVSVDGGSLGAPFFASSENISISGMMIETAHRFSAGDRLQCSFYIGHNQIKAEAMVMRTESGSGRNRYGVRFVNIDTRSLVIIEQFVKNRIKSEEDVK